MTKKEYAKQIVAIVKTGIDEGIGSEILIEYVEGFLTVLKPVDTKSFSKWGYPECQVEEKDCWINNTNI